MNNNLLNKVEKMKENISQEFSETTSQVNTAATDTYNSLNKSLTTVNGIKNKVRVLSDMFTDLRVLNKTAKNSISLSTIPIVENTGILVVNDKFKLDTLIKKEKEYDISTSGISSIESYTVTSKGKRGYVSNLFKSNEEILLKFPNDRYTFSINLNYPSIEQINSIKIQLGLLTESYPIINSIKYVDKDNVERTAVILNNTSTTYDLDFNREVNNEYHIDISAIYAKQISIELTSRTKSSISLKEIKTSFKKEIEEASLILGPIHTEYPILKLALDCEEVTSGCSFEISTDKEYWVKIDSSSIITEQSGTKIIAFNTINTKSFKTTEDVYTFYIKLFIKSSTLTNDDVDYNIYSTIREDHTVNNDTLNIVEDNQLSVYRVKHSDFIHGKYQYVENLNIANLTTELLDYIEVNGTPKVLGLVSTPYSVSKNITANNVGIGCQLKYKRLSSEPLIDSRNYDLANSKVYDIYCREIEQTINTKVKDNLCFPLKTYRFKNNGYTDFTAPYDIKNEGDGGKEIEEPQTPIEDIVSIEGAGSSVMFSLLQTSGTETSNAYTYSHCKVYIDGVYRTTFNPGSPDAMSEERESLLPFGIRLYEKYQRAWAVENISNEPKRIRLESIDDKAFTCSTRHPPENTSSINWTILGTIDHDDGFGDLYLIHAVDAWLLPLDEN